MWLWIWWNTVCGKRKFVRVLLRQASDISTLYSYMGTLVQCRSQKFQKCVIYLSEICQKTVSFKNLSEKHLNCVRFLSEMCQIQISVIILSEIFWKCLIYVSVTKKCVRKLSWLDSENCQKSVINITYDSFMTQLYKNHDTIARNILSKFLSENCQLT